MIRRGTVISIDHKTNTGVIKDVRGKEFFFSNVNCQDKVTPRLNQKVKFVKDSDFQSTNVATQVTPIEIQQAS